MKLKSVITISGRISSGKSFAANLIKNKHKLTIGSFGGYLKYYCEINNLSIDRRTLQNLGENFVKINSKQFLNDVITYYKEESNSIVLEGLRHKSIFEEVKNITSEYLSIFIDTDQTTRYKRYSDRIRASDTIKTYEQFMISDTHPVEMEIESLKERCDLVYRGDQDYSQQLLKDVLNFIG